MHALPAGPVGPATCFCMAHELSMGLHFKRDKKGDRKSLRKGPRGPRSWKGYYRAPISAP